jgi:hypothetical protein
MKLVTLSKIGTTAIAIGLTAIGLAGDRSVSVQRTLRCDYAKPLTENAIEGYDANGVKVGGGTFWIHVIPNETQDIPAIVFPRALSPQIWTKLPSSAITYVGKGGDERSWRDRWSPDYFYGLEVPPKATGLAFSRLCYRRGDVTVHSIKTWEEDSQDKEIIVNHQINLSDVAIPTRHPFQILVNAGSDRRDILGVQTEVYFTTHPLESQSR